MTQDNPQSRKTALITGARLVSGAIMRAFWQPAIMTSF